MSLVSDRQTDKYTFKYSEELRKLVIDLHAGKENFKRYDKYIESDLGGPESRLAEFLTVTWQEISYHCGDLHSKRAMDFGCGTGASTVALAMNAEEVIAFDIHGKSAAICDRRLQEHGLREKVKLFVASSYEEIAGEVGTFDFILMHGVIEHIPLSIKGLRKRVISQVFDALNPGGFLYIYETPNRIWPKDVHTTGLWWINWAKPGSKRAYARAVKNGHHSDNPLTHSDGPLGLEERGAWGMPYFEFLRYLPKGQYSIVNTMPGHNRNVNYTRRNLSLKRRMMETALYYCATKPFKVPIVAFCPMFSPLVVQKIY